MAGRTMQAVTVNNVSAALDATRVRRVSVSEVKPGQVEVILHGYTERTRRRRRNATVAALRPLGWHVIPHDVDGHVFWQTSVTVNTGWVPLAIRGITETDRD